jgi:soluble lytic murein transglycosylase-like protein
MRWRVIGSIFFLLPAISSVSAQQLDLDEKAIERGLLYEGYFLDAASRHGVDARILWVIGYLETRFNSGLVSPKGARGLMQLMPATAARFGATNPHEAVDAIDAAAKYLRLLLNRFDGRIDLALAAYNAGEETVEAYRTGRAIQIGDRVINSSRRMTGGVPPYRETQNYVIAGLRILNNLSLPTTIIAASPSGNSSPLGDPARKSIFYIVGADSIENFSSSQIRQSKLATRRSVSFISTVE